MWLLIIGWTLVVLGLLMTAVCIKVIFSVPPENESWIDIGGHVIGVVASLLLLGVVPLAIGFTCLMVHWFG